MLKHDFFLAAMQHECYRRMDWVLKAFSIVKEEPDEWMKDPYPYRIVQTPEGHMYVEPNDGNQLHKILGTKPSEPPFQFLEKIFVDAGRIPNLKRPVTTTFGNVLVNYVIFVWPFGDKMDFLTGQINAKAIEKEIEARLVDDPEDLSTATDRNAIYVHEYLKFAEAIFSLGGYTQLCVPSASEKTMQSPPGIAEYRKKLIEEKKDSLNDPATIAWIDAKLVEYDREYMKDDPAMGFLTNKSFDIVRKRLYLMHGAEAGFGDGVTVDLVPNSLEEGWDINHMPAMVNYLRNGSYSRGAMTALGGWAVKFFYRVMQNTTISGKDCGSRLGMPRDISEENIKDYIGFWVVGPSGPILIRPGNADSFIGKRVTMRSPLFCKSEFTGYCECCVGVKNAQNPNGLGAAAAEVGSQFMGIYMALMHGKALKVAKYDFKKSIS